MNKQPQARAEEHKPAEPNLVLTSEDRNETDLILADSTSYIVEYVRTNYQIAVNRDEEGKFIERKIVRGAPVAALVAICQKSDKSNTVAVGWSKRHTGIIKDKTGRKIGNIEPLPFTKESARRCAILRALADGIVFKEGSRSAKTEDGNFVPNIVIRHLPRFMEKVQKKFGKNCEMYNVK